MNIKNSDLKMEQGSNQALIDFVDKVIKAKR